MFNLILKNINKDLVLKFGVNNTDYVLNILGRGESFLKTICLLPMWFNESLGENAIYSEKELILLCIANFKAWIGYTLYDYLRDGKIDKDKVIISISIANICTHEALFTFKSYAKSDTASRYLLQLFNTVDMYYIKSINKKNIDFNKACIESSNKSIAASICVLLILPAHFENKNYYSYVLNFFKYYFRARQLSDDLDDYKKDLKLKIITPATILLNNDCSVKDMTSLMRKKIDKSLLQAKKSIRKIKSFNAESFIERYVKPC